MRDPRTWGLLGLPLALAWAVVLGLFVGASPPLWYALVGVVLFLGPFVAGEAGIEVLEYGARRWQDGYSAGGADARVRAWARAAATEDDEEWGWPGRGKVTLAEDPCRIVASHGGGGFVEYLGDGVRYDALPSLYDEEAETLDGRRLDG